MLPASLLKIIDTISEGFISDVTEKILSRIEEWKNRPLSAIYPIILLIQGIFLSEMIVLFDYSGV